MLLQGLVIMVVGISTVFSFLLLLVLVMKVFEKIISRFNYILPDDLPKTKRARAPSASDASSTHDLGARVAIAIAVAMAEKLGKKS